MINPPSGYVQLVLFASDIPLDSVVRKVSGNTLMMLRDNVWLREHHGRHRVFFTDQSVLNDPQARFVVVENGPAQHMGYTTELVWYASLEAASRYLNSLRRLGE